MTQGNHGVCCVIPGVESDTSHIQGHRILTLNLNHSYSESVYHKALTHFCSERKSDEVWRNAWHIADVRWVFVSVSGTWCLGKCCHVHLIGHIPLWIVFWFFFLLCSYFQKVSLPPLPLTAPPTPFASSQDRFLSLPFQQQNSSPHDVLSQRSEISDHPDPSLYASSHSSLYTSPHLLGLISNHKFIFPALVRTRSTAWGSQT